MKRHLMAVFLGAVVGALLGWFTPELQRVPEPGPEVRQLLALKSALVVAGLGYLVSMYLLVRRRAYERWKRRR